ncbi:TRAPP trafficking subunit Trs65-domain-containing protein [Podospora conica]|nr:TRAPP trafficking subunit Trs65-domain-containing protein [Schizothecium conicum]
MALADHEGADSDVPLPEDCYLSYLVPSSTAFDPKEALDTAGDSFANKLAAVEQRDQLFFDETVNVYFVLQTLCANEDSLRSFLRRIVINLETQIVNTHAPERDGPPASESISSTSHDDIQDVFITADGGEARDKSKDYHGGKQHMYAVWKLPVFLSRPRMRLQGPTVAFSAVAGVKPPDSDDDSYMDSCVPSGMNLLEAFANDPMLGGVKPELSALRVSRVAPVTHPKDALTQLQGQQRLTLRVYPIVHTRVRFSRPNTTPPSPALIALLEVDFAPFSEFEVSLDKITLAVPDSTVEDLNTEDGMALPLSCVAHDHLTFLYRLAPRHLDSATPQPNRNLVINIDVVVLVAPGCTPRLSMAWNTSIDFTLPVNPGFGQSLPPQPIQRSHRPSQLSIGGGGDGRSLVSPSVSRPDALPSLEPPPALETALPDFGITMTFSGPSHPVRPGEEFVWSVFVVNRARPDAPSAARKLALVAIPRRRRNDLRVIRPPSSNGGVKRDKNIADAVLDENVVHAMQRSSVVDGTEVVCLSADVRIGPLAPNACAVAELRFLALKEGVVGIEAVRVIDLGSQEHVDVRELPTVVVRAGEGVVEDEE